VTVHLDQIRLVTVADVYKAGRRAASLRRGSEGIEFAYELGYLQDPGPAVATSLPITDEPVRTTAGAVPPFFAGLLPEGRRLSALRRMVKTSVDDELSLLLAVGRDAIGDVQVVAQGEQPTPAEPLLQVTKAWTEVRFTDVVAEAGMVDPVALPGVQDKASARMISVPVARAGERYLLKIDPPEYPHVVENEAFFLDLAGTARIEHASTSVVHDADGRSGLLVRRFDRLPEPSGQSRPLACEDACQVLRRWPADKYNVTAEEVVTALADQCPARAVAVRALYQQLCFAWLTGNGNVHAKNLSILATPDGEWRVAPAYDLSSTVPYDDLTTALTMQGRSSGLSRHRLLQFGSDIRLPARAAERVVDELLERLDGLADRLLGGALPYTAETNLKLAKELRYRRKQAERRSPVG
jgi:serine/threonine-protein kinase HipA